MDGWTDGWVDDWEEAQILMINDERRQREEKKGSNAMMEEVDIEEDEADNGIDDMVGPFLPCCDVAVAHPVYSWLSLSH